MRAATSAVAGVLVAWCLVTAIAPQGLHAQAGSRERTIFVSTADAKGEPVEGLGPNDFIVREDGQRREILRVSRAVEPIDIALLVDTSAAARNAVSSLRMALTSFVTLMAPDNQIAIVGLADRPTILTDYTSNRGLLDKAIGRVFSMSGSGMTLLDAIWEVSNGLRRREATRAVIVPVITNGTEFTNRYARDVIGAVRGAGASLHAVVVGVIDGTDPIDRERTQVLDEGTRTTGGQHVTLLTENALDQALRRLARELSSQYKVVYGRPESLIPPEKTEVASGRAGVTMRGTPARGQGDSR
jgi:VWFA-related protein